VVVTVEDKAGQILGENEFVKSGTGQNFAEGAYDPSRYILSTSRNGLSIEFPETGELCMIRGDGSGLWADEPTTVEEDLANLQLLDDQELGGGVN